MKHTHERPSSASFGRRAAKFLFDTALGPIVLWWVAAGIFLATAFVSCFPSTAARIAWQAALCLLAIVSFAVFVVWILALDGQRWKRAAIQFGLGAMSVPVFIVALGAVIVTGASEAKSWAGKVRTAAVPDGAGGMAFAVEYMPAHPFLAEYRKTIVFPSGKRIGILMDTGGAGPFAVYRLPSGFYHLADGLQFELARNDYRVNPAGETVEMMRGSSWIQIPDGTIAVTGGSSDSIVVETRHGERIVQNSIPVGDSLLDRTYLGLLHPNGQFESDAKDQP